MSMTHWLVVAIVVLLLFGRGKISELMGDVAKGIKSFKKGMAEEERARRGRRAPEADRAPPGGDRLSRRGAGGRSRKS